MLIFEAGSFNSKFCLASSNLLMSRMTSLLLALLSQVRAAAVATTAPPGCEALCLARPDGLRGSVSACPVFKHNR